MLEPINEDPPLCPNCGLATRLNRINYDDVWACRQCGTQVGCHKGTHKPLGVPADCETRGLRRMVHGAFDHIWREGVRAGESKAAARTHAYIWLAANLGLPPERCHVAMFDADTCRRALTFLRRDGVYYSWEDTQT